MAFTHGTNDAQKTMGTIALALVASGHLGPLRPPADLGHRARPRSRWAPGPTPAVGASSGPSGTRIAKIDPPQGFAAQTACAAILGATAHFGFPVSTTHTISGSVLGAGAITRLFGRPLGVAGNILVAWILTIPVAALVGAGMHLVTRLPGPTVLVFGLAIAIAATAFAARRWEARRLAPRGRRRSRSVPA